MPHGMFTNITLLGGGRLLIEAEQHESESIDTIDVAVVALNNFDKRVAARKLDARLSADKADKIGDTWQTDASTTPDKHGGSEAFDGTDQGQFVVGEAVVLVGAVTHRDPEFANPFLWYATFKIQPENGDPNEVKVEVVD